MLYLLDADTLIRADAKFFKRRRFPIFWEWLFHQGLAGHAKIPIEQYNEVTKGKGDLVDWLKDEAVKDALLFPDEVDAALVAQVTAEGYAADLNEAEIIEIGMDPFLIAHAAADTPRRAVVTFEVSAPRKQRANRKVPDVCAQFNVKCIDLHTMLDDLDFTEDWKPPGDND